MELSLRYQSLVCTFSRPLRTYIYFLYVGTAILLKPGIISGGPITHECPLSRSIGYFLEPIIILAPFAKKPLQLTLHGITTDEKDLSVRSPLF